MRIYFYKAIQPGFNGIYSHGIRIVTRSIYSHCELQFSNGKAASSSYKDGGVRFKDIEFDPERWDYIELPDEIFEAKAWQWFKDHEGQGYDLIGDLHFVISVVGDAKKKWFCSEAIAASLGIPNAARFDPGTLYQVVSWMANTLKQQSILVAT